VKSFTTTLPQFLQDLQTAPPNAGEGVHAWPYITRNAVKESLKRAETGELYGTAVIKPVGANDKEVA
jgi:hypothetical protein